MEETITIKKKHLKKLVNNFNSAVSLSRTFDLYELDGAEEELKEMEAWVEEKIEPLLK